MYSAPTDKIIYENKNKYESEKIRVNPWAKKYYLFISNWCKAV